MHFRTLCRIKPPWRRTLAAGRIRASLLSRSIDEEGGQSLLKQKKRHQYTAVFKNLGFDAYMVTEFDNHKSHNPFDGTVYKIPSNTFIPDIIKATSKFAYYHGYWLNDCWFNSYRDLQLMSLCKGMVLSKSAFCLLAWLLNQRKEYSFKNTISAG